MALQVRARNCFLGLTCRNSRMALQVRAPVMSSIVGMDSGTTFHRAISINFQLYNRNEIMSSCDKEGPSRQVCYSTLSSESIILSNFIRCCHLSRPRKEKSRRGGFNVPCKISPQLQQVIGEGEFPRPQIVKKLWEYIHQNHLRNPQHTTTILCNDALRGLFGTDTMDMFEMQRMLTKHVYPIKLPGKTPKENGRETTQLVMISDDLKTFLGIDGAKVDWKEVVKRTWDYIKRNQLQDPADKRRVICDDKLQQLFSCSSFNAISVTKYLAYHLLKPDVVPCGAIAIKRPN